VYNQFKKSLAACFSASDSSLFIDQYIGTPTGIESSLTPLSGNGNNPEFDAISLLTPSIPPYAQLPI